MANSNIVNNKRKIQDENKEDSKVFYKEICIGDDWKEIECEYEFINSCAIEKGGDYLVFANEGAEIPNYVKTIGPRAFSHGNIKEVVFPNSVEIIENNGCSNGYCLESVVLNEGLKKIGELAFYDTKVKSIEIPSTVDDIASGTFQNINITVDPRNTKYEARGNCLIEKETKKLLNGTKDSIVPNDIKVIDSAAFYRSEIEFIEIPSSVEVIEKHAFSCSNLREIKLNEGLKKIGKEAFRFTKIKRISIPNTVKEIEEVAFGKIKFIVDKRNEKYEERKNCLVDKDLNKIVLGGKSKKVSKDIKHIGDSAFELSNIKSLRIPKSVERIGILSFGACGKMRKLILNEGLKKIGKLAFMGLKIKSIIVPSTVDIMDDSAFAACERLKIIYCRAKSKPIGWDDNWNSKGLDGEYYDVVWGYKGK